MYSFALLRYKRRFIKLLILLTPFIFFIQNLSAETIIKRIQIISDGEALYYNRVINSVQGEIKDLLNEKSSFLPNLQGNWDIATIQNNIDTALNNPQVDLIIAAGLFSSQYIFQRQNLNKPVIIADFLDRYQAGNYLENKHSAIPQCTFLLVEDQLQKEFNIFHKIVPFKKLAIVISPVFAEYAASVGALMEKEELFDIQTVTYQEDIDLMVEDLKKQQVDAVYLTPPTSVTNEYYQKFIETLIENKIPSFSMMGYVDVERGVLVGYTPKFLVKFSRRIAILVERIFSGEKPENIEVAFDLESYPIINAKTANKLGITIPFALLFDAELIDKEAINEGTHLSLENAVNLALKNNFSFRVKEEEIKKAQEQYHSFWSSYLPNIKSNLSYNFSDPTSNFVATGQLPRENLDYEITLDQLIFSDPAITNIRNSKLDLDIQHLEEESLILDITQEVIAQYLSFLKAKTQMKEEERHLNSVKKYLRIAQSKNKIGTGTKEDVLRWQSELADAKARMINAESMVRKERVRLNKLMNVKQETPFIEKDVNIELLHHYFHTATFFPFLTNIKMVEILFNFLVKESIENSYSLKVLNLGMNEQKNTYSSAMRKFFLPEISAQGSYTQNLYRGYNDDINPARPRKEEWSGLVRLDYPIFEGTRRISDYLKEKAEYKRLDFKYQLKTQEVELNVREITYQIYYSWPKIEFSRQASEYATENLNIIQDKYEKGTVSITDLIVAEDDQFEKELDASLSVYEFLSDLTNLNRYLTNFFLLENKETQELWKTKVINYFKENNIDIEENS